MKTILVVDDDRDLVLGLSVRLKAAGYHVAVAQDGLSAVSAAMKQAPHLILLDIGLPAGDGLSVLKRLKGSTKTSQIPVLVLTGRDPATAENMCCELGADGFFQKPADNAELLKAIRELTATGDLEASS